MKTTIELLDAVKARHGLTSDYQLAKMMGFNTSRVSHYRGGRRLLSDETAIQIAELLNRPAGEVLALVQAERATSDVVKKAWSKAAKALAGTAVMILAGSAMALAPLPAFTPSAEAHGMTTVYYVKLFLVILMLVSAVRHGPALIRLHSSRNKPLS